MEDGRTVLCRNPSSLVSSLAADRRPGSCSSKLYSITSSAIASYDGGTSRPSALAVVRLMTRSRAARCAFSTKDTPVVVDHECPPRLFQTLLDTPGRDRIHSGRSHRRSPQNQRAHGLACACSERPWRRRPVMNCRRFMLLVPAERLQPTTFESETDRGGGKRRVDGPMSALCRQRTVRTIRFPDERPIQHVPSATRSWCPS